MTCPDDPKKLSDAEINEWTADWLGWTLGHCEAGYSYWRCHPTKQIIKYLDFMPATSLDQWLRYVAPKIEERQRKADWRVALCKAIQAGAGMPQYIDIFDLINAPARTRCEAVLMMEAQ